MVVVTCEELFDFAIQKEGGAAALYQSAASIAEKPSTKMRFRDPAEEERKRRRMVDPKARDPLEFLAPVEAKHTSRPETEYQDQIRKKD